MKSLRFVPSWFTRHVVKGVCVTAIALIAGLLNSSAQQGNSQSESQVQRGFAIAPVHLELQGKNRALVGVGSYLVNAFVCNDCHTSPAYKDNPFNGDPGVVNIDRYMAGGRAFPGGVVSRNLTPDALGKPAGLTLSDFKNIIRSGVDDDAAPPNIPSAQHDLLQVMPWPVFRYMTDNDLNAIYEYLSSIPCIATSAGLTGEPPAHSCTP